jgi:hypothetical protein
MNLLMCRWLGQSVHGPFSGWHLHERPRLGHFCRYNTPRLPVVRLPREKELQSLLDGLWIILLRHMPELRWWPAHARQRQPPSAGGAAMCCCTLALPRARRAPLWVPDVRTFAEAVTRRMFVRLESKNSNADLAFSHGS